MRSHVEHPGETSCDEQRCVADPMFKRQFLRGQTIEASFKGKGAWKKTLPRILETLEALGRASRVDGAWRY